MPKSNWKSLLFFCFEFLLIILLIYSRFINLGWGLPYPFHPDEHNMAVAIQQLNWQDRFNPHFFAYGQWPLYLGYLISIITRFDATLSLRIISAVASLITFFVILKTVKLITKKIGSLDKIVAAAIIIFSPYAVQFSHFGTTESLLMLFYSLIVFYSLKKHLLAVSLFSGLALAAKVSAGIFLIVPVIAILAKNLWTTTWKIGMVAGIAFLFFILFSPNSFIHWPEFLSSIKYESDVALGRIAVFYTRQFIDSTPVIFQTEKIFPYALGLLQFILFIVGFLFLSWRDQKINLLRLAFLVYFIPNAFLFAKWTRFMAPIFPIMTILAILLIQKLRWKVVGVILTLAIIIPGINYLSVYQNPDTRVIASEWIYKNIPENSYILSETANVVDIPIGGDKNYEITTFNFYELDNNPQLQDELQTHLEQADYVFVPSRRIFANHPKDKYPRLYKYYEDLNSGSLGFKKVAEFSTGLKDEGAEETWTVFDHPTIRIFKKIF